MRLPLLFRRENSQAARQARQDEVEKALTDSLRRLSEVFKQAAEFLEARRLKKGGYTAPHTYLERTGPSSKPKA